MSEPKFTPGPWTDNCQYSNQEYCRFDQMIPGRPVRTIYSDKACTDVAFISHCVGEDGEEEYEATARLIAAAPDLYRIVKNLIATRFNASNAIIEALELLAKIDGLAPALSASESPPPHLLELLPKSTASPQAKAVHSLPGTSRNMPDLNADIAREVTRRMGDAAEYVLGGHSLPMQAFYSEDHGVMAVIIRCSQDWTGEDISDEAQIDLYERLNAVANAWLGEILDGEAKAKP